MISSGCRVFYHEGADVQRLGGVSGAAVTAGRVRRDISDQAMGNGDAVNLTQARKLAWERQRSRLLRLIARLVLRSRI